MAAVKQRLTEEKADWIIYVTDVGQSQHLKAVFKAARMAGWLPAEGAVGDGPKVDHVGFGLVLGEDGKRLRTRNATDVRLLTMHILLCHRADRAEQHEHRVSSQCDMHASGREIVMHGHGVGQSGIGGLYAECEAG